MKQIRAGVAEDCQHPIDPPTTERLAVMADDSLGHQGSNGSDATQPEAMTEVQARKLTAQIKFGIERLADTWEKYGAQYEKFVAEIIPKIKLAYEVRAWESLGYRKNGERQWVADHFDAPFGRLPTGIRQGLVEQVEIAVPGISSRAIAALTGVSESTIRLDRGTKSQPKPATLSKREPADISATSDRLGQVDGRPVIATQTTRQTDSGATGRPDLHVVEESHRSPLPELLHKRMSSIHHDMNLIQQHTEQLSLQLAELDELTKDDRYPRYRNSFRGEASHIGDQWQRVNNQLAVLTGRIAAIVTPMSDDRNN